MIYFELQTGIIIKRLQKKRSWACRIQIAKNDGGTDKYLKINGILIKYYGKQKLFKNIINEGRNSNAAELSKTLVWSEASSRFLFTFYRLLFTLAQNTLTHNVRCSFSRWRMGKGSWVGLPAIPLPVFTYITEGTRRIKISKTQSHTHTNKYQNKHSHTHKHNYIHTKSEGNEMHFNIISSLQHLKKWENTLL